MKFFVIILRLDRMEFFQILHLLIDLISFIYDDIFRISGGFRKFFQYFTGLLIFGFIYKGLV